MQFAPFSAVPAGNVQKTSWCKVRTIVCRTGHLCFMETCSKRQSCGVVKSLTADLVSLDWPWLLLSSARSTTTPRVVTADPSESCTLSAPCVRVVVWLKLRGVYCRKTEEGMTHWRIITQGKVQVGKAWTETGHVFMQGQHEVIVESKVHKNCSYGKITKQSECWKGQNNSVWEQPMTADAVISIVSVQCGIGGIEAQRPSLGREVLQDQCSSSFSSHQTAKYPRTTGRFSSCNF